MGGGRFFLACRGEGRAAAAGAADRPRSRPNSGAEKKTARLVRAVLTLRSVPKENDQTSFGLATLPPPPAFGAGAIPGGGVPLWMDGPLEDGLLLPQPVRSRLKGNATSSAVSRQMMRRVIGCNDLLCGRENAASIIDALSNDPVRDAGQRLQHREAGIDVEVLRVTDVSHRAVAVGELDDVGVVA